jgi:aspartyl-tRNA synthetase
LLRTEIASFYRRYNDCCNAHEFGRIGEFVAEHVQVDGEAQMLDQYIANLRGWVSAFPDFRWEIRHLLIEGDRIAARFHDTGTHQGTFLGVPATGRAVSTTEFAMYRLRDHKIVEVWGTVDNLDLLDQLR